MCVCVLHDISRKFHNSFDVTVKLLNTNTCHYLNIYSYYLHIYIYIYVCILLYVCTGGVGKQIITKACNQLYLLLMTSTYVHIYLYIHIHSKLPTGCVEVPLVSQQPMLIILNKSWRLAVIKRSLGSVGQ